MIPDCLKNLVGIYEGDEFSCDEAEFDNKSTSGLYLTQDPSFSDCRFKANSDCELLDTLSKCRDEAYRSITSDLTMVLAGKMSTRADVNYFIGQDSWNRYLAPVEIPAIPFIDIPTLKVEGAFIEIQKITLMLTPLAGEVIVPLRIKRIEDGEIIITYNLRIESLSVNPKPVTAIKLPCDGKTYRIEYDYIPGAFRVVQSNYYCGCGDKLKSAAGFMSELKTLNGDPVRSYGICIWAAFGCNSGLQICSLLNSPQYKTVIAYMVRMKTIELALKRILMRTEVSKLTVLGPEEIGKLIDMYISDYSSRLNWFGFQKEFEVDGFCVVCSGSGMRKVSLMTGR